MFAVPVVHVSRLLLVYGENAFGNFQLQYHKWPLGAAEQSAISITLTTPANEPVALLTWRSSVFLCTSECVWRGTYQYSRGKHSKAASCGLVLVYVVHLWENKVKGVVVNFFYESVTSTLILQFLLFGTEITSFEFHYLKQCWASAEQHCFNNSNLMWCLV